MNPINFVALGQSAKNFLIQASRIQNLEERLQAVNTITSLQEALMSLQAENSRLEQEIRTLQDQIRKYEDWNQTKDQYKLTQNTHGASLFIHTKNNSKACPNCLGKKLEIILQPSSSRGWHCHNCQLSIEWEPQPTPKYDPPKNPLNRPFSLPH